jgi:galactofuranosylgalactofuranosylrhamnosyl-N-acetylglucosaminyl-diphospho-decaprenol beta-1,5/1,6-galactofuranosyltransferase
MQLHTDRDELPPVRRKKPPRKGRVTYEIPGRLALLVTAGLAPLRQLRGVRPMSQEFPEVELTAMDAAWYRLASFDSAVVSMNDGTSAALYRRDPDRFRDLMRKTIEIHERFRREWPRLAQEYRAALADITSPEAWEQTLRPWTDTEE